MVILYKYYFHITRYWFGYCPSTVVICPDRNAKTILHNIPSCYIAITIFFLSIVNNLCETKNLHYCSWNALQNFWNAYIIFIADFTSKTTSLPGSAVDYKYYMYFDKSGKINSQVCSMYFGVSKFKKK